MAKFRKRPVVVEAVQWFPSVEHEAVCTGPCALNDYLPSRLDPHLHTIHRHQTVYLEPGDWIITEPGGKNFYPCNLDTFAATYEPVEGDEAQARWRAAIDHARYMLKVYYNVPLGIFAALNIQNAIDRYERGQRTQELLAELEGFE